MKLEGPSASARGSTFRCRSDRSKALLLPRGASTTVLGLVLAVAAARFLVRVLGARGEPL